MEQKLFQGNWFCIYAFVLVCWPWDGVKSQLNTDRKWSLQGSFFCSDTERNTKEQQCFIVIKAAFSEQMNF